jgi:hypothetical protein
MKKINNDNIDEIMFQLLEGEITGEEREQLLSAIAADKGYSALWKAWQHTVLSPENEDETMDIRPLKKKTGRIIPFNYKYAIAAMLVLGLGLAILLTRQNPATPGVTDRPQPGNNKAQEIKPPKPEVKTLIQAKEDTIITLKEKIRMMAGQHPSSPQAPQQVINPSPESDIKKQVPEIDNKTIAQVPEQKIPVEQKLPDIIESDPNEHILVSITTESKPLKSQKNKSDKLTEPQSKTTLLSRLLGGPKIKLENDSSTRTNKKLIIENNQYKIIAGF